MMPATRTSPRPARGRKKPVKVRLGTKADVRARTQLTDERLAAAYPVAECALIHADAFQLLVATILSAQSTDVAVNLVTPALFKRYPDARGFAEADPAELEVMVHSTGFFRQKTKSVMGMAQALLDRFDGQVPPRMEDLVTLPGVGRKTANVILGVAFGLPGLAVDTHVTRLTARIGLTRHSDPVKIEAEVCANLPAESWSDFGMRLIMHGRQVCDARKPLCPECVLNDYCPSSSVLGAPA